jgi:hypothetical protein
MTFEEWYDENVGTGAKTVARLAWDAARADLHAALDTLLSLPNWENRILSGWKDIDDAIRNVHEIYYRQIGERAEMRLVEKSRSMKLAERIGSVGGSDDDI